MKRFSLYCFAFFLAAAVFSGCVFTTEDYITRTLKETGIGTPIADITFVQERTSGIGNETCRTYIHSIRNRNYTQYLRLYDMTFYISGFPVEGSYETDRIAPGNSIYPYYFLTSRSFDLYDIAVIASYQHSTNIIGSLQKALDESGEDGALVTGTASSTAGESSLSE